MRPLTLAHDDTILACRRDPAYDVRLEDEEDDWT